MAFFMGLLTGVVFGTAFYKVGATRYSRMIGMASFTDNKIAKFAFFTIATGSIIYGLGHVFGVNDAWNLNPRIMPYLGPAHILGGMIFGSALAIGGYCPGACVIRSGTAPSRNKFEGFSALIGLFVGVYAFLLLKEPMVSAGILLERPVPVTLHGFLGIDYGPLAIAFGILFLFIAIYTHVSGTERRYESSKSLHGPLDLIRGEWNWAFAAFVAGCTVVWASSQGGYLGFSGSVLAIMSWAVDLVGINDPNLPPMTEALEWRAALLLGLVPGGLLARLWSIHSKKYVECHDKVPKVFNGKAIVKAFIIGMAIAFGAMTGGGCTTGAYMAAFPTLSMGSFMMAATFFVTNKLYGYWRYARDEKFIAEIQKVGDQTYN